MRRMALIDADILRYQYGAMETPHPFLKDQKVSATADHVCRLVDDVIAKTLKVTQATDFKLFLTGPNNFRFDIATEQPYKGNRASGEKPAHWKTVGAHLARAYGSKIDVSDGYEADDAMAFHRFKDTQGWETIICSRDKDLETVPGWHYRWACGAKQPEKLPYFMTKFESNRFFMYQCLIGDNTDNIAGCGRKEMTFWGAGAKLKKLGWKPKLIKRILENPEWETFLEESMDIHKVPRRDGVGPAEANKILEECDTIGDMVNAIREQYRARFEGEDWEAILLENARLLYMGQTPTDLFEWNWMDDVLELDKESENEQSKLERSGSTGLDDERPLW